MRRSDLSTLRKTFIWPSEWYNDSKYYNLLFEDLKIFNYLIGIFYRLKCPTSLFKVKRLSNNFIIISMDIYIMYDIYFNNYYINKMKLYYIYYYWRLLMKNFFYLLSNNIFVNNSLKIKRQFIIRRTNIKKKKKKNKNNVPFYRIYKKIQKNIIIENIKKKVPKFKKNNLFTLCKLQRLRTFILGRLKKRLKKHFKKHKDILKIIKFNYSKKDFLKKKKIKFFKKKKKFNKYKELNYIWYFNINNYIYLFKSFFELKNNYLLTNNYFSPLLKNYFYSNGLTINSFINNINIHNYFFKLLKIKKKKEKKWIPWEEYKLKFKGKSKLGNNKFVKKKKINKSKYYFLKNIVHINKRIKNNIKLDIIRKKSFFFNVNNNINKTTYGNNRWLSNFLLLSYLNNLDVNLLSILFNNNWFINSFLNTKKNINLINNHYKIKKWLLSINLLKKLNNKYKLKGLLKNNLILFNSWFLKNIYKYFIENSLKLINKLILKMVLKKKRCLNSYKFNLIKDSVFFILINNYIFIKKTNLFIKNTTNLISINIHNYQSNKINIKNNLKIMSTLFFFKKVRRYKKALKKRLRWYEASIQMAKLMHSIEITFAKYSNKHYLIMPNYYYKTKPMLSSAKLVCEYICFLFEKGYTQNYIYKKIRNWQYLRPRWVKRSRPFSILKTRKRISLSGIRILCTGPFRKAKRKQKFHYHLWLRKYRLYGKMPLQSFNQNIDYYNLAVRLKYASRGIKVWLLFEKKKNEKKIYL